jgi:hypothetical protein
MDFEAENIAGEAAKARGDEAAAGANLQHLIGGQQRQRLQHPAFDHGLEHALAMTDRHRVVGIGQRPVFGWYERLARQFGQRFEDTDVEHVPRPDLLLDHGFAGLGVIDGGHCFWSRHSD